MTALSDTTAQLVRAYYASWQNGTTAFDEARLREILAPDLLFEGPIAGRRTGVDSFMRGLADFVDSLRDMRMLQQVNAGNDAAALYDCDLGATGGTLRFGEFLRVDKGRIQAIRLVYDPSEFRRLVFATASAAIDSAAARV